MPRSQGTSRKGKPKKADRAAGMGRALQRAHKNKFKCKSNGSSRGAGMAASGAQDIGMEIDPSQAASNKMKSVLEMNNLTDFLHRAELADQEFSSEREQFVVIDSVAQEVNGNGHRPTLDGGGVVLPPVQDVDDEDHDYNHSNGDGQEQQQDIHTSSYANGDTFDFKELSVPRRPKWDSTTTPEELNRNEREAFLEWRRAIAVKEVQIETAQSSSSSSTRVIVTPFEKNIEVWRQLWRVLERSQSVALVVDGRNPEFYISRDLRHYIEVELGKSMIVVVNKCDYLSQTQREMWHEYFKTKMDGLEHVFFSAVNEQEILDGVRDSDDKEYDNTCPDSYCAQEDYPTLLNPQRIGIERPLARKELLDILCAFAEMNGVELNTASKQQGSNDVDGDNDDNTVKTSRVEFGMVGFPNVGKSSVLNVLVGASKNNHKVSRVAVACQPGKTKHFQTLNVPDYENITLVDCPGLVFPSFVSSPADLVLAGVYPLAQVRDFWPAVEMICRRIPRELLEAHFGIELPRPSALDVAQCGGNITLKAPTAEELLGTFCIARSLLAPASGVADYYRASRVVLRDYVTGNLLYCHCPPLASSPSHEHDEKEEREQTRLLDNRKWEAKFHRETLITTFRRQKKLREKLGIVETSKGEFLSREDQRKKEHGDGHDDEELQKEGDFGLEADLDMLELMNKGAGGNNNGDKKETGGKRGKKHKSMQKWGKKGRKQRNKDPYGCHCEPDEELLGPSGSAGLVVNAGKYGGQSYTRPTHKGARSAT